MNTMRLSAFALALVSFSSLAVNFQDPSAETLLQKLGSDDFEVQGKAAKALEALGPDALPQLRKVRDDESGNADIRAWCKRIIEKIESADKRFKELAEKLASADDEIKEAAEAELRKIGQPALPHLRGMMKSEDKNLRRRAERIFLAIAAEGGDSMNAGGRFGGRFGGRENLVARGGGTRASESTVLAALKWLARHQNPDGSWGAVSFANQCVGGKCAGAGDPDYDAGVTGLALLAFLGAGYSHLSRDEYPDPVTPGRILKFGDVVKNGLKWLLSKQDDEGCIGGRGTKHMYAHAIATQALTEAYGMSATQLFKGPALKAVEFLVAAQNPGKAWRYTKKSGDNDTSVTGWAVMALVSAERSELKFPFEEAYASAGKWLDSVTDSTVYYRAGYNGKSSGKVFTPGKNENFVHHETMTAIGVLSRLFMKGTDKKDPALGGVQLLVKDLPQWKADEIDFYYWHHASYALFHYDGPDGPYWKKWNEPLKNALVPNQKVAKDGCASGSWNSEEDRWGFEGGRVYAVAINALTLETYYRYANLPKRSSK